MYSKDAFALFVVFVINFRALYLHLCVLISNITTVMAWGTLRTFMIIDLAFKNISNAPEEALKCCGSKPSQARFIRRISVMSNSLLNELNSTEIRRLNRQSNSSILQRDL